MKIKEPLKVVIADDESLVINLIQDELESLGLRVVGKAADGRQAVELVRTLHPDVILMDIAMPELDGIAAAAAIQLEYPIPVVILSAHDATDDVERATAAGVGAFLVKPPRADELDRAISIAVARHADLMKLRRLNEELQRTMAEARTLGGLLPICCSCKKIRDDQGYWSQVESYLSQRTGVQFTHSYCPECLEKYFPSYGPSGEGKKK
ncbi:MAG: ANTAR domain-containing response regulator [Opitutales bacterium]